MTDVDRLQERVAAVERAVVDGDGAVAELEELDDFAERLDSLEGRADGHERRTAALEARVDALEGAIGNVESVNRGVERRANAAVAAVDRLETRIEGRAQSGDDPESESGADAPTDPAPTWQPTRGPEPATVVADPPPEEDPYAVNGDVERTAEELLPESDGSGAPDARDREEDAGRSSSTDRDAESAGLLGRLRSMLS